MSRRVKKGLVGRAVSDAAHALDQRVGWHRMPTPLGILTLIAIRNRLREENLYDTDSTEPLAAGDPSVALPEQRSPAEAPTAAAVGASAEHVERTVTGAWTSLDQPAMGSTGARFGRNVPLDRTYPEPEPALLSPNPRDVSRALMTRETFLPATTLNVLAAAWLQFEVHDWFSHGKPDWDRAYQLPLADDDPWPEQPMRVPRGVEDPTDPRTGPPTWISHDSHWWDASQLYGRDAAQADAMRTHDGGRLRVDPDGRLPADLFEGVDLADVAGNDWIGLHLLHTLFTHEHNAICDRIRSDHPGWSDDRLYATARLVTTALIAKIHTVEWTPAIIAHPTTKIGMRVNWYGILGEKVRRRFGRVSSNEVLSGIPGGPTHLHGVPYTLTEEFTAVYRMHPLLPDDYAFRSAATDDVIRRTTFPELNALHSRDRLGEFGMTDALYSLGVAHPGALTLHNFPRFLQDLDRPDGTKLDLAAVDVLRIRERGVPRYREFRELFHLRPPRDFADLTPNPVWQQEIRDVYEGDLDRVDLMVGLYGELPPKGFGFSDTAFRVFVLMATRRLEADRFFTVDYRPEVYSEAGLQWIDDNSMVTVLLRHAPQLAPVLGGVTNAFAPWPRTR